MVVFGSPETLGHVLSESPANADGVVTSDVYQVHGTDGAVHAIEVVKPVVDEPLTDLGVTRGVLGAAEEALNLRRKLEAIDNTMERFPDLVRKLRPGRLVIDALHTRSMAALDAAGHSGLVSPELIS
jgi:hypothetical protein